MRLVVSSKDPCSPRMTAGWAWLLLVGVAGLVTRVSAEEANTCSSGQWQCGDTSCVLREKVLHTANQC